MSDNYELTLPSMGEGVNEATIVKWLKQPDESVSKDEPILEVSTDKVDTEIQSPYAGYMIQQFAQPEQVVQVNEVLAQLSNDPKAPLMPRPARRGGERSTGGGASKRDSSSPAKGVGTARSGDLKQLVARTELPRMTAGMVRSSPLVRRMARQLDVDLTYVRGSGLHGRITREDLERYLSQGDGRVPQMAAGLSPTPAKLQTTMKDGKEFLDGVGVERVKMDKIRRLTAEHMVRSVQTSPHVTTTFEIDLTQVQEVRTQLSGPFQKKHQQKLTYTPFFLYAALCALKEHPHVNSSVDGDEILLKSQINMGCAVATEKGLLVPVIKGAEALSFEQLALALNDLVARARSSQLKPDDIIGGTFSVTNPGLYGSLHSQPIINQPQVAIMSVGAIVERPVVQKGKIGIAPLVQVGLTFDHRVIDGEGGALFLKTVKEHLEAFSV